MACKARCHQRRCCVQNEFSTELSTLNSEVDTDSHYYHHKYSKQLPSDCSSKKIKHCIKEIHQKLKNKHDINGKHSHDTKCPVYVHNMKMQKRYSQNDAYSHNYRDYYDDRANYMKNKFDSLTLNSSTDYSTTRNKVVAPAVMSAPCPVHCKTSCKQSKKTSRRSNGEKPAVNEEVINKLEETYWAKWKPMCNSRDCLDKPKIIRTEEDFKRKSAALNHNNNNNENHHPHERCQECMKYLPPDDTKAVRCLHRRTVTKESKSSEFIKSEYDEETTDTDVILPCGRPHCPNLQVEINHGKDNTEILVKEVQKDKTATPDNKPLEAKVLLEGQDEEKQLKVTQYASEQANDGESNAVQESQKQVPVVLKHTDSFILNSIKQSTSDNNKPRYQQPTSIKLSNTTRPKGHSYPLKPILKKDRRATSHSPKKPLGAAALAQKPSKKH